MNIFDYMFTAIQVLRITWQQWLGYCGIRESGIPNVKWIYYTYMGKQYKIPLVKKRGPSPVVQNTLAIDSELFEELAGPYGDFHGQRDLVYEIFENRV